jgi:hypothetical protein
MLVARAPGGTQPDPDSRIPMHHEPSRPTKEHELIAKLAGNWTGEETMYPSPWDAGGGKAIGRLTSKIALDGFCVTTDYEQERDGQVCYRGHGVYSYDPNAKEYHMTWFDTMSGGIGGVSKGRYDGKTLAFSQQNPMGHSRYSYTFPDDKRCNFKIEFSEDGKQWVPFIEGNYSKR